MSKLSKRDNLPEYRAPKKHHPQIYVFEDRHEPGWLKVGETTRETKPTQITQSLMIKMVKKKTISPMPTSDD